MILFDNRIWHWACVAETFLLLKSVVMQVLVSFLLSSCWELLECSVYECSSLVLSFIYLKSQVDLWLLYLNKWFKGKEKSGRPVIAFPPAARRMDTLNDLLALSDLVSLHCSLSDATLHILNSERLQHIKPGNVLSFLFGYWLFRALVYFFLSGVIWKFCFHLKNIF